MVYASFGEQRGGVKSEFRYAYLCQVGVGAPALPALAQNKIGPVMGIELMMPPDPPDTGQDTLASWHDELKGFFEVATLYTMIAGLLNILAVYDAFAGPVFPQPDEKKKRGPPDEDAASGKEQKTDSDSQST